MAYLYIINFIIFFLFPQPDPLKDFHLQLSRDIERNTRLPPEADSAGNCYHYSELLKVSINKQYNVISVELSDSAPAWLVADLQMQNEKKRIHFNKLDSIAKRNRLKDCIIVFPFVIESDDFPCGKEEKRRRNPPNYFKFGGKNLQGKIYFGKEIRAVFSTRYIFKKG